MLRVKMPFSTRKNRGFWEKRLILELRQDKYKVSQECSLAECKKMLKENWGWSKGHRSKLKGLLLAKSGVI